MRNNLKEIHRSNFKKIRKKMLPQVESQIIQEVTKVIENLFLTEQIPGFLGLYWPLNSEVDLRCLKGNRKIPIALPASHKGGQLTYHHWDESPLKKDFNGIPAPIDQPILKAKEIGLLLVPALAIDQNGYRLGYGGGYFDRLRAEKAWKSVPALVVLPKACVAKELLPKDGWDIPFDGWINEDGEFQPRNKESF